MPWSSMPSPWRGGFSGVVRLDSQGEVRFEAAYELASRRWGVPVGTGTRFGIASGTKGLTALTVLALVARGTLGLGTTARSVLDPDDDDVLVLTGHHAGVSFRTSHDRRRRATWTVLSNTSEGAWSLVGLLSHAPA